jgi:hypothetical protein
LANPICISKSFVIARLPNCRFANRILRARNLWIFIPLYFYWTLFYNLGVESIIPARKIVWREKLENIVYSCKLVFNAMTLYQK